MEQVLICLKKNKIINVNVLDNRRRELIALGMGIIAGDINSIAGLVEKAINAGATREDILKIITYIVGDERLLSSIIELLRALDYEENQRAEVISVLNDVRE